MQKLDTYRRLDKSVVRDGQVQCPSRAGQTLFGVDAFGKLSPDWWSAADMVVLLEGSPLFTEQHWSSVRVTIGFLVTSLTKALLSL